MCLEQASKVVKVRFLPDDVVIEARPGECLLDVAERGIDSHKHDFVIAQQSVGIGGDGFDVCPCQPCRVCWRRI